MNPRRLNSLVAITACWSLVAAGTSTGTEQDGAAAKAAALVQQLEGTLQRDAVGRIVAVQLPDWKATDAHLATLSELQHLQRLRVYGTGVTDAGIAQLRKLTELRQLSLLFTAVTNDGLGQLQGLADLEVLDLRGSVQFDDRGLAQLSPLKKLRVLKLQTPSITDKGVKTLSDLPALTSLALKPLTKLKQLNLAVTFVTAEGVKKLRAVLPKCEIQH